MQSDSRIDDQPARSDCGACGTICVRIAQSRAGEQCDFGSAQQLRAAQVCARRIEFAHPAAEFVRVHVREFVGEERAARRIERRRGIERRGERAQIKSGASHYERARYSRVRYPRGRITRKARGGPALGWIGDVYADMRHARPIRTRRFRSADIKAAINLPRVRAEYREAVPFGEAHRDRGFPCAGRAADDAQFSVVQIGARVRPS